MFAGRGFPSPDQLIRLIKFIPVHAGQVRMDDNVRHPAAFLGDNALGCFQCADNDIRNVREKLAVYPEF